MVTPDEEIRDRVRRLHDWAEQQPHGVVLPPLPETAVRPPDRRRRNAAVYLAAAAAVTIVAVAGQVLGFAPSGRAILGGAGQVGAAPGPTGTSAPATSPAPTTAPSSRGATTVPPVPTGPSTRPAVTGAVVTGQGPLPSRSTGRPASAATQPAVGTVIGLEPVAAPGSRVRHKDLDLRVDPVPTPASGTDAAESSFLVRPGLASTDGLSFESVDLPGYFVSVSGDRAVLRQDDGTAGFGSAATFVATAAPTRLGTALAPFAERSSRLHAVGGTLSVRPPAGTAAAADATAFAVRPGLFTQPVNAVRTTGWILGPAGRCVDIWGDDNGVDGTPAGIWDCEPGAADQRLSHELDFSLRTLGRCLDVVGADNGGIGAEVVLWACEAAAQDQKWVQSDDGTLRSRASGLCLGVVAGGTGNGTRLELNACTGGPEQQFRLT